MMSSLRNGPSGWREGLLLWNGNNAIALADKLSAPRSCLLLLRRLLWPRRQDGDLLARLDACWDATAIIQIADNPGRLEPGSGEINFATVLGHLHRRGFGGLVELEHHWSQSSREAEQRGVEYLRRLDSDLKPAGRV